MIYEIHHFFTNPITVRTYVVIVIVIEIQAVYPTMLNSYIPVIVSIVDPCRKAIIAGFTAYPMRLLVLIKSIPR
ncbi:MAG: hypothetical protein F7B59_05900 [Desulfurococcales archaeon]|nr:hypothetical protein [Desulfurococcales archaeon]